MSPQLFSNSLEKLHKALIINLIRSSSRSLTFRFAAPRVQTGVNPVFGDPNRETSKAGETKGPFPCLWYDSLTAKSFGPTGLEPMISKLAGQFEDATEFCEVILDDVLEDVNNPSGLTWFDRAQYIIADHGKRFKYLGGIRIGLSVAHASIYFAALRGATGFDDK